MSLTFALQALLVRHESYIADSERDRADMTATIEKLEREKRELQLQNARTIKENRALLDKLEKINGAVAASDAYAQSLAAALESTRLEVRRLTNLTSRTETLDRQLEAMETEQVEIQDELENTRMANKGLAHRCKVAERTVAGLQDQIDRIEREATEERERHDEIISRMSRRGIKGCGNQLGAKSCTENDAASTATNAIANASSSVAKGYSKNVQSIKSQFVSDLLEDNASLRKDTVELRELLYNAQVEIGMLREKSMYHRPIYEGFEDDMSDYSQHQGSDFGGLASAKIRTLEEDLSPASLSSISPALHVHHHHYHDSPF